jgi:antitoxin ParD1/3/4
METILITLPPEDIAELRSAVEAGEYETSGAAMREALQDWRLKRKLQRLEIERLGTLWDEGIASGDGGPVDFVELRVEAERRLALLLGEN